MTRVPRLHLLFALATVLALTFSPMAGARSWENPAVREAGGGWFGAALKWVEDLAGFRRTTPEDRGRSGQAAVPRKDGASTTGGSCIDPQGRPYPCPR